MRFATLAISMILLTAGCSRREELPVSHTDSESDTAGAEADPASDDPIRVDVRRLHAECDETVVELQEGVEDADRRENILTAVAALAYVVGEIADGSSGDAEGALYGPGSTQSYRCTDGEGVGCGFQPQPSRSLGEGGPIDQQTDEVHLDAADQVRAINRGVDALDDFLFSNPDIDGWTEAEHQRYRELAEALSAACHR
jgi:hypothetical protein